MMNSTGHFCTESVGCAATLCIIETGRVPRCIASLNTTCCSFSTHVPALTMMFLHVFKFTFSIVIFFLSESLVVPQTCTRDAATSSVHMKGKIPRMFPKKKKKNNKQSEYFTTEVL